MNNPLTAFRLPMCLLAVASLAPGLANAAESSTYAKVRGAYQGEFKGAVTRRGFEGAIEVISMDQEFDTGAESAAAPPPGGRRPHKPIRLRFYYDLNAPSFSDAAFTNEALQVQYSIVESSQKGDSKPSFTVNLTNARIVNLRVMTVGEGGSARQAIEVTLSAEKILWSWIGTGGITRVATWPREG
jgi:type VI secretion system Hcp family effector